MKAMILAAGRGERMRPLTDSTPKPLLLVRGKPLIGWHLEALRRAGVTDVVINTAHLGEQICATLGDGRDYGVVIEYSHEQQGLETAGGIINALPMLGDAPFIVVNGDVFTDFDFSLLTARHGLDALAHLVMVENPAFNTNGDFYLTDEGLIRTEPPGSALTFAGLSVLSPRLFDGLAPGKRPLAPVLRDAIRARQVRGEHHAGRWSDVGTLQRLESVNGGSA